MVARSFTTYSLLKGSLRFDVVGGCGKSWLFGGNPEVDTVLVVTEEAFSAKSVIQQHRETQSP